MSEVIERKFYRLPGNRFGTVRIELDQDGSSANPRENETTGSVLVTWERNYHSPEPASWLPDELYSAVSEWASRDDVDAYRIVRFAHITHAPILYIGGLTRGGNGELGYDDEPSQGAGYVGLVVVTGASWRDVNGPAKPTPEAARDLAHWEVRRYSEWVTGNVFGYVAETSDGETVDSCWGYIGSDEFAYMFSQGAEALGEGAQEISESEYNDATDSIDA
jgi:hypothetical protein